jgi:hypothetical protein
MYKTLFILNETKTRFFILGKSLQTNISRKKFIASVPFFAILPGVIGVAKAANLYKLSFSTLGCPDWSFDKIIDFAKDNQYTGIEVRGILREMDLTKCLNFPARMQ